MKQVSVEVIQKCPNCCVHCSSLSNMNCTMKISFDKMREIIDGIVNINTEVLSISGGEPFLHEDLFDMVRYAKKRRLKTYIYTSGIMVNKEGEICSLDTVLLNKLNDVGVDKIIFDLPAIDNDIYDDFMGTKGYLKYALKSIADTKNINIWSEIHFVPTKINIDQIDKILLYAKEMNIDRISFLGLIPHGRAKGKEAQLYLSKDENEKLKEKLRDIRTDNIRIGIPLQVENNDYICYAGREKLCVRYDGRVFGCEAFKYVQLKDENGEIVIPDSIYEKRIEDIYFNSEYLKQEIKFVSNQLKEKGCCEKCPVQQALRRKAI